MVGPVSLFDFVTSHFQKPAQVKIGVVGLGYVGLPLAVSLARSFSVVGFDINQQRVQELQEGRDRTGEVDDSTLRASRLHVTCDPDHLKDFNVYIVTVPTPVTDQNVPDLTPIEQACATLGLYLKKGDVVVFESTVYPGVTEDVCGPLLEKHSDLKSGKDFFLGYSPERINPGDKVHTVDQITKVVAAQTPDVAAFLKEIYGSINQDNIFVARCIKTAEAAKVIENTQRDINIAFMNEITGIFQKIGISVYDVLEAAGTKWNFLPFQPGLVGGHCIGVDPYYLAHCAESLGQKPEVILAGRRINEQMSQWIADSIHDKLSQQSSESPNQKRLLVLGLTFKENVPDLRNTKVVDMLKALRAHGYQLDIHDPHADPKEAKKYYNIDLLVSLDLEASQYDGIIGAVPHKGYQEISAEAFNALLKNPGLVADIKGLWKNTTWPEGIAYWTL